MKRFMDYEVETVKPRGKPKITWDVAAKTIAHMICYSSVINPIFVSFWR